MLSGKISYLELWLFKLVQGSSLQVMCGWIILHNWQLKNRHITLMKHHPDQRPPWWNIILIKDHLDETSCWSKTTLMKHHADQRPSWWNMILMTDHPDDRSPWWQTTMMKYHLDDRPPWWNITLMTDQSWWNTTLMKDHLPFNLRPYLKPFPFHLQLKELHRKD